MKRFPTFGASRLLWLSAACLLAFVAVAPLRAEIIERVIVKVNGEIFTKTDLETRQVAMLRDQTQNQQLNDADLKKRVDQITPQVLVDAIDEMLLVQRGKELGYKMSEEQFTDILNNLKNENHITTEEQFQAALKQEGLTLSELRKSIERKMLVERVEQNEVFSHINVTQDEMKRYYDDHKGEFTSEPTVTLREIQVKVPSDGKSLNAGQAEDAQRKAESIRERALKGENFEKLVDLSDAPTKANRGLIGPIKRSDLDANFVKVLSAMKVGDISPVLRTANGFDIVKLEASSDTTVQPFEQARTQIANKVFATKQQGEFENYMRRLRASAIIDWKVPELKKLYDQQVARAASQPAAPVQ